MNDIIVKRYAFLIIIIYYLKKKRVGKPLIPNLSATCFYSVASTLAR